MSIRYWLYAIALGGCLIASTPLFAQQSGSIQQPAEAKAAAEQGEPKPPGEAEPSKRGSSLHDAINRIANTLDAKGAATSDTVESVATMVRGLATGVRAARLAPTQ